MTSTLDVDTDTADALQRAMELFGLHGYHAVSIDDIVRHTGLNRHVIYNRYGSKLGLLKTVLARYRENVLACITNTLQGGGTRRERIERLLRLREPGPGDKEWTDLMQRGCLAIRVSAELRDVYGDLADDLNRFAEHVEELLVQLVREGQACGEFRSDRTAEDLASVLVSGFLVPLIYTRAEPRLQAFLAVLD